VRDLKYYDLGHVIKYCAVSIEEDACCGRCGTMTIKSLRVNQRNRSAYHIAKGN